MTPIPPELRQYIPPNIQFWEDLPPEAQQSLFARAQLQGIDLSHENPPVQLGSGSPQYLQEVMNRYSYNPPRSSSLQALQTMRPASSYTDPRLSEIEAQWNQFSGGGPSQETTAIKELLDKISQAKKYGGDPNAIKQAEDRASAAIAAMDKYNQNVSSGVWGPGKNTAQFLQDIGIANTGLAVPLERAQEQYNSQNLAKQQQDAIYAEAQRQQDAREALRRQLLGEIPGMQEQMGKELLGQQEYAYGRMQPLIEQRLNAMGILQSGALPEAQAKYQKELEMARQARLQDFGQSARQRLSLDFPWASLGQQQGLQGQGLENTIGMQREALRGGMDLDRAALSRMYQEQDIGRQMEHENNLSMQALAEARRARDQQNNTALWAAGIGAAGSTLGTVLGGPLGGVLGGYGASRAYQGMRRY